MPKHAAAMIQWRNRHLTVVRLDDRPFQTHASGPGGKQGVSKGLGNRAAIAIDAPP